MTAKEVLLRECQVFSALHDGELRKIAELTSEKRYEAGASIFHEGDSADELLVVQEGKVALQMTLQNGLGRAGRKMSVDIVSPNEVIGWSAIVEPYTYRLAAVCLQNVTALSIPGNSLRWLLEEDLNIGNRVLKGLNKVVASRLEATIYLLASERLSAQ